MSTVNILIRYLLLCLFGTGTLCLVIPLMAGEARPQHDRGVGLYFDQDLLTAGFNQDRDYTTGVAAEFFWQEDGLYLLDRPVKWLGHRFGLLAEDAYFERSFILGSVNFTPDDLSASRPQFDDRPYASLIYLGNKRVYTDDISALALEMRIGVLGTSVAREIQQALHASWRDVTDDREPVDPKGWQHQISNGGEPTLGFRVAYAERLAGAKGRWDLTGTTSTSLGYQTNASVGLSLRAGDIASPVWSLPYDPINRGSFLPSLAGNEWYLWAAYRARVVAYDVLLQGQFRDSAVTFNSDQLRHVVHDAGVGVTLSIEPMQVTFAINGKTSELNVLKADRSHLWGGMYVMLRY
ncbi:lipid A deacylase LpxR family protein [Sulfuriflexus sp.]|uniref:lipid A deacylase LpxR family protein n=1 Tax=Sulfuriflexus sp. TaxID=2015443 RepID=UPI0028CF8F9B|nr:lipid A deacylase LpxR family protein [Sulfuriflexus sp.]MDT8405419.1 lipid A deacylase LpxR family protein [Sulfuriflexus sp.]